MGFGGVFCWVVGESRDFRQLGIDGEAERVEGVYFGFLVGELPKDGHAEVADLVGGSEGSERFEIWAVFWMEGERSRFGRRGGGEAGEGLECGEAGFDGFYSVAEYIE